MTIMTRALVRLLSPRAALLALAIALPAAAEAQANAGSPAEEAVSAAKNLPLDAAERKQFLGTYLLTMSGASGRTMPFRVYEQGGALYGQPQGGQAMRLLYQGENRFLPEHDRESVMTFTIKDGRVTRFLVNTPQGTLEGVSEAKKKEQS